MPPDPQLVIFDCDGVLVDSEGISNSVLAEMLTAEGLPMTTSQARRDFQGLLLADIVTRVQEKLGRELPADWVARYETVRAGAFTRGLTPVDGAAETVQRLMAGGMRVCVASQGKLSKTSLSLALTGLDRLFPERSRFSAYSVAEGKPAPDLFLHAANAMQVEPVGCVVVEDSASGVAAAVAAGMRSVAYAADGDEPALRDAGANDIVNSLRELPALLDA